MKMLLLYMDIILTNKQQQLTRLTIFVVKKIILIFYFVHYWQILGVNNQILGCNIKLEILNRKCGLYATIYCRNTLIGNFICHWYQSEEIWKYKLLLLLAFSYGTFLWKFEQFPLALCMWTCISSISNMKMKVTCSLSIQITYITQGHKLKN